MSEKVKYSIIIPTRNGGKYIESTINSILDCKFHDYEIVVSVNFSQDNTLEILEKYNNKIKVVTPPRPLCMAKHYEWCLTKVVGDWVTILGDDDAVMPFFFQELERLTKISNKEKINAISFKRAYYFWVEDGVTFDGKHVLFDGKKKDKIISTRKLIIQILSGGKSHYHLPQLYTNNLIRKKLLDEIKIKYKDLSPDVDSGVKIALHSKKILRSEMPIFWTGTSGKSNNSSYKKITTYSEDNDKFLQESISNGCSASKEIGNYLYRFLRNSNLYVLSAIGNDEVIRNKNIIFKMYNIFGLCGTLLTTKDIKKNIYFYDLIKRFNINIFWILAAMPIAILIHVFTKLELVMEKYLFKNKRIKIKINPDKKHSIRQVNQLLTNEFNKTR